MAVHDDATTMSDELVALRRHLHQIPEIGFELPQTQAAVLAALAGLPLEIIRGKDLTSVVAVLRGGRPGPLVLLRGDMDALPVTERTGLDYASTNGAMHACGNDLHTAGLVGATRLLAARKDELAGDVLFMFQPGEEGQDGAAAMLREGLLDAAGRRPDAAYGLHVMAAGTTAGVFTGRPGPLMAASDEINVRVVGAGGHGSAPHNCKDPIPVACEIVTALQTAVTRQFDAFDPVVVTVGLLHAGTKRNVIPDDARIEGTVRTFTATAQDKIERVSMQVCEQIAAAHGLSVDAEYVRSYPVTVNDPDEHEFLADTVRDIFGADRFEHADNQHMGSEDFSRVLAEVPGAYVFLSTCATDDPRTAPYNHSSTAAFDDAWLPDGAALLAELAIRRMQRPGVDG
ncbi:MAG: M20 metallopeptidase family protein [Mycobacteriales bacterium]